ncbi:hypothetical protein [Nesterenkonia haasae]|uniref:hypothetical protein n=1 Tax=Nesterenkonia haasae TaxID=2587813 RepID=UPI0013912232|nr:hypothetical protein [Nesterenkonia haasae]NDK33181.1 hypothetical protein [Nesterenkonia haasae]
MPDSITDAAHTKSLATSFITDSITPQRHSRNIWQNPQNTVDIFLEDARSRRRIIAKKVTTGFRFIRGGKTIGGLDSGITTLVSHQALRASRRPQVMRHYFAASDVPCLPADTYHVSQFTVAQRNLPTGDMPVVVRPASPRVRSGATTTLVQRENFTDAWETAAQACHALKPLERFIEIQEYRQGLQLRIYVVGEEAVAALVRIPFHVVGDGLLTIRELVENELQEWRKCNYLSRREPTLPDVITRLGSIPDDVPLPGEVRLESQVSDFGRGEGISIDVTDQLDAELAELAVDTMWAFPGLAATAVDILAPSLENSSDAVVVGIDPTADLGEFLYPTFGRSRRVTLRILDHMIATARR